MKQFLILNIQSTSDIITNSSTELFVVKDSRNLTELNKIIKHISLGIFDISNYRKWEDWYENNYLDDYTGPSLKDIEKEDIYDLSGVYSNLSSHLIDTEKKNSPYYKAFYRYLFDPRNTVKEKVDWEGFTFFEYQPMKPLKIHLDFIEHLKKLHESGNKTVQKSFKNISDIKYPMEDHYYDFWFIEPEINDWIDYRKYDLPDIKILSEQCGYFILQDLDKKVIGWFEDDCLDPNLIYGKLDKLKIKYNSCHLG